MNIEKRSHAQRMKAAEVSGKHFGTHEPRSLALIAAEIRRDWKKPYFGAVPYLRAMASLDRITDAYGEDSGESIVLYFLANANTWRGPIARHIKAELKAMAGAS